MQVLKPTNPTHTDELEKQNQWVFYDTWGKFDVLNAGKWFALNYEALLLRNLKLNRRILNVFKVKYVDYERMYYPKDILRAGRMLYQYNWVAPYEKSWFNLELAEAESVIILKRIIGMPLIRNPVKLSRLVGCGSTKSVRFTKQSGCSVSRNFRFLLRQIGSYLEKWLSGLSLLAGCNVVEDFKNASTTSGANALRRFYVIDYVSYPQFFKQKRLSFQTRLSKQSNMHISKHLGSFLQWLEISRWVQRSAWWQIPILVQLRPLLRWLNIIHWTSRKVWRGLGVV